MQSAAVSPHELARDLDRSLRPLIRLLREAGAPELSAAALSVLAHLHEAGPQRVTDLAARERVTQPSATTLVDRLERRGLVTRGTDPDDRRAVRVALTPAGGELLAETRERRAGVLAGRIEALPDADREALAAALPALHVLTDPTESR